jgi:hypothetical protein
MEKLENRDLVEAQGLPGMDPTRDKQRGTLTLSHEEIMIDMLQKYGLEGYQQSPMPMDANQIVGSDPHRKPRETTQSLQ